MASPPRARRANPAPATTAFLVRHGTTPTTGKVLPGRAKGLHLSDTGKGQAESVATRLAQLQAAGGKGRPPIAAVYASPMERTRETAAPIGAALGMKVVPVRGLLECDFGEWTGRSLAELSKLAEWTTVQRYPSGFRFPGGESFAEMQTRMADTLALLAARHQGESFVAVSHADPIKAAVALALGTHLDLFQRIVISPCSVSAVRYAPTGPAVLAVNSTGSLLELRPS